MKIVARSKVWLEVDGKSFLGDGRERLLKAVDRTGSINAAARELGISYRKVWAQLQAMEASAPFPILERRTGGKGGGSTVLTEQARILLTRYELLRTGLHAEVDGRFASLFPEEAS
jgi:molybdate transport system regulatory protein